MQVERLLIWMTTHFRPFLCRPESEGGVGWMKADCIRQTKMGIEFLRSWGIAASPLSVVTEVNNKQMAALLKAHTKQHWTQLSTDILRATPFARLARLGRPMDPSKPIMQGPHWRGHLVAIVQDKWLLDLTLDSVNDMGFGIKVPPMVLHLRKEGVQRLLSGEELVLNQPSGETVVYYVDNENHYYEQCSAWYAWSDWHTKIIRQARRNYMGGETT